MSDVEAVETTKQVALIGGFMAIVATGVISCTAYTHNPSSYASLLESCNQNFSISSHVPIENIDEMYKDLYAKREACSNLIIQNLNINK